MTTITLDRAAVQQALDALKKATPVKAKDPQMQADAIIALLAALEQPQPSDPECWERGLPDSIDRAISAEAAQSLRSHLLHLLEKCRVGYLMSKGTRRRLEAAVRDLQVLLFAPRPALEQPQPAAQAEPVRSLVRLDEQYRKALSLAIDAGRASVSMIQRRLCIGYGEAQALVVRMVRDGYIGIEDTPGVPSEVLAAAPAQPDHAALLAHAKTLLSALDAVLDFAGTVGGGAAWWDDVWDTHDEAVFAARTALGGAA